MKKALYILTIVLLLAGCSGKQEMSAEELKAAEKELISATIDKDIDKVKELIKAGVDVNGTRFYYDNTTALHIAAQYNQFELAKLLIDKGANIDTKDSYGNTPLHSVRKIEIAKLLVENGADVNSRNRDRETPLHNLAHYCKGADAELVKFYISKGADVNARNNEGYTPLDIAVAMSYKNIAAALHEAGGEHGDPLGAELLKAAKDGDLNRVKELVKQGVDISFKDIFGYTPLLVAAIWGHKEIVELLIANGANINLYSKEGSRTALHLAAEGDSKDLVKLLIDKGAYIEAKSFFGETPLHTAARSHFKENGEIVETLISAGASVNSRDECGQTPLWNAAEYNHLEAAKILIKNGVDINAIDDKGMTPLDKAKTEEMKKLLRSHGALTVKELKEKEQEK